MAYGYRINAEDVFFRLAEEEFAKAESKVKTIKHYDPDSGDDTEFQGYQEENAIASASIAVIGWATSFEAFVNLIWNQLITPNCPTEKIASFTIKGMSTVDKAKELLKMLEVNLRTLTCLGDLKKLYEMRNKIIHFKESVSYQGFSMANQWEIDLSQDQCKRFRKAVVEIIRLIGKKTSNRTNFTKGSYEIVYLDQ